MVSVPTYVDFVSTVNIDTWLLCIYKNTVFLPLNVFKNTVGINAKQKHRFAVQHADIH